MTIHEIKAQVQGEAYEFLRTNEHLKNRILFLTLGGSHAYGTAVASSDVDVRGCAMQRPSDLIGLSSFDTFIHKQTDTTIYGFNKLIKLFLSCNPNCIEMLGCLPSHYIEMTESGKLLLDNRKLFLSRMAARSFGGYAAQQLRRLKNALVRGYVGGEEREKHILSALQNSLDCADFNTGFSKYGSVRLYIAPAHEEQQAGIACDIHLDAFPVQDFKQILNTLSEITKKYKSVCVHEGVEDPDQFLNHRNRKKDSAHLNKHAMHLIRLYLMCLDILEKEEIITYRKDDRDFLLQIRNGAFQNPDGTYQPEFFELVESYEKRMQYALANTALPAKPDFRKVEELTMEINRKTLYA